MSAAPSGLLLVQLPHVVSAAPVARVPSRFDPVRMSCVFGVSPRPFTTAPFSVSEVSLPSLLLSLWRSATFSATFTPLALYQGPAPMRSRALTAGCDPAAATLR